MTTTRVLFVSTSKASRVAHERVFTALSERIRQFAVVSTRAGASIPG